MTAYVLHRGMNSGFLAKMIKHPYGLEFYEKEDRRIEWGKLKLYLKIKIQVYQFVGNGYNRQHIVKEMVK